MMDYYLEQQIELVQEGPGWIGIWSHETGQVGIGYFPTAASARDAVLQLIRRDVAVRTLLEVVNEWLDADIIHNYEYEGIVSSLMEFILTQEIS